MHSRICRPWCWNSCRSGLLALICIAGPDLPASAAPESVYTRHEYMQCENRGDDDPMYERRCSGHDGIQVVWTSEPDNSSVSFGTEGSVGGEFDPRFTFAVVGNVIEWRGPRQGGKIVPYAAIVRYRLCRTVEGPCAPELAVYRLIGRRASCIAGSVNGRRSDANLQARELADTFVRDFDCENGKRRRID